MSGSRKANRPLGPGYMPKGGRAAAAAHNDAYRAASAAPSAVEASDEPLPTTARTDVRASARAALTWSDRIDVAMIAVVSSAGTVALLDWVSG